MSDIPPDTFRIQCMYAASYIAFEFCSEYAYAMQEGLMLARSHFIEQKQLVSIGENVSHDEVETILQAVRSKSGYTIEIFNEQQLQTQAKLFSQQGEEKKFQYQPEIIMKSVLLDRRYNTVAKRIIECIFEEYQATIEKAKADALTIVYKSPDRGFENAVEVLVSTIHDRCRNFRLSLIEIRQKVEPILSVGTLRQVNGQSQDEKLAKLVDDLTKHDDTGIDLNDLNIVIKEETEEQSVNGNVSVNTPKMLPPNLSSTDSFLSTTMNHSSSSEMIIDTSQVNLTTPLGILPEANLQEQSAPGSSLQTASTPQSLPKQARSSIPEKRKHVDDPPAPASKKSQLRDVQDHHAFSATMVQNHDQYDSSDDDIEITGVILATRPVSSGAGSSNYSTNTTRPGVRLNLKNSNAIASVSSKAQKAHRPTIAVSNRALDAETSNQGTAGSKGNSQSASQNLESLMKIDQILEKGVELIMELSKSARRGLKSILYLYKCEGIVELLKKGLSPDSKQLIVSMTNGEDINPKRIKRIHENGTQKGKVSAMMLFIASNMGFRPGTGEYTQSTYKTFITLSTQSQSSCIAKVKQKLTSHSKAAYAFLHAEDTKNCEKLCIPMWTLSDAIRGFIVSSAPNHLRQLFTSDDHMVREVAHLVRCILIVVCGTIQDDQLDLRFRKIYKRGKPFIGLNDVIPFDTIYASGVSSDVERSVGSTSGHKMNIAKNYGTHQITENSVFKYIENTKMFFGHGIKGKLTTADNTGKGTLNCGVYLSNHMSFRIHLSQKWLQGKNMNADDSVTLKLIIGSQYHFSSYSSQTGAKLVICNRDSAGHRQEHQILLSPSGVKVINQILSDRHEGKFGKVE